VPREHGRSAATPEGARKAPEDLNWLLETDVICQPAKRAPKRDLFAESSEGMIALALLRPELRKLGKKAGTKCAAAVTLRAAA